MYKSLEWTGKSLKIIDQTLLPSQTVFHNLYTVEAVFDAIRKLQVRGAPAIGVAAAFGLYLGLLPKRFSNKTAFLNGAKKLADYLASARPTAVNLKWALSEVIDSISQPDASARELLQLVLKTALRIQMDDEARCEAIGLNGAPLIEDGMTILTHCNTGALATAGIGTAFGVLYTAHLQGKKINVLVDETRPLLQGARLTMWEFRQVGIPATLITDNMAAYAMQRKKVDLVIVGADRIARNGDVANKIGTYSLAVSCHYHRIPFYVAAPLSTFDLSISAGKEIPIEERSGREVTYIWEQLPITVENATAWNPAFDVTPAALIHGIITEKKILKPPFEKVVEKLKFNGLIQKNYEELIV